MPVVYEQAAAAAAPAVNAAQQLALIQQRLEDLRQQFRLNNAPANAPPPPLRVANMPRNRMDVLPRERHVQGEGREEVQVLEQAAQAMRRLQEMRDQQRQRVREQLMRERQEQLAGLRQARQLERELLQQRFERAERLMNVEGQGWGPVAQQQQQPLVVMPQLGEAARVGIAGQERRRDRFNLDIGEAGGPRRLGGQQNRGGMIDGAFVDEFPRGGERRVGDEFARRRNPPNPVGRANREAMVVMDGDEHNPGWRQVNGLGRRWAMGGQAPPLLAESSGSEDGSSSEEDEEPLLAPRERPRVLRLADPRAAVGLRPHGGLWRPRGWQQQDLRAQTVFTIRCGWCHTLVSTRGLMAPPSGFNGEPNVFTSDLPIPGTVGQISEERTRQCYCVSANIGCHCCGNQLGHHVRSLCSDCRKTNHGHTWVFGAAHVDVCARTMHAAAGLPGDATAMPRTWGSLKPADSVHEHEAVPSVLSDIEALR